MNEPEYPKSKYNNSIAGAALSIGVKPETLELFVNQMREYDRAERENDKPDSKLVYWWAYVEIYNYAQELKKELNELRSSSFVTAVPPEEYDALAAEYVELKDLYLKCRIDIGNLHKENERLRKAGDAMADTRNKPTTLSEFGHLAMAWNAAKEGGDAK